MAAGIPGSRGAPLKLRLGGDFAGEFPLLNFVPFAEHSTLVRSAFPCRHRLLLNNQIRATLCES